MVFVRYRYPLPNNGSGYSFTEHELIKLLDSVYEQGYTHGVESTIEPETITASYGNLQLPSPLMILTICGTIIMNMIIRRTANERNSRI